MRVQARTQTQETLYRRRLGRRRLLGLAGGTIAATMIGPWGPTGVAAARAFSSLNQQAGFGPLVPDPNGRLALPADERRGASPRPHPGDLR